MVFPSGAKMKRFLGDPNLEHATYSCPWANHDSSSAMPVTFKDCPCALLIDMANASLIGNWRRLKSKGISVGMSGILGMKTSSPLA